MFILVKNIEVYGIYQYKVKEFCFKEPFISLRVEDCCIQVFSVDVLCQVCHGFPIGCSFVYRGKSGK